MTKQPNKEFKNKESSEGVEVEETLVTLHLELWQPKT